MSRRQARRLAQEAIERGDPLAWFDELYSRAGSSDLSAVPWADLRPNPNLVQWLDREQVEGAGKRALVVGCGLGDDVEELSGRGFDVTAFDISNSAIAMATGRFSRSEVEYLAADLFHPPEDWEREYDLVHEAYTLQVLPQSCDPKRWSAWRRLSPRGGILLVIARGRDETEDQGEMPWPLTQDELAMPCRLALEQFSFEDYFDAEQPPVRRFRAGYRRPQA